MTADPFGPHNLPYGVFITPGGPHVGVRLGDGIVDLTSAQGAYEPLFADGSLDRLLAAGPTAWSGVRSWVSELVADPPDPVTPVAEATMLLPFAVADYVDFYSSLHHATNVGRIFRPEQEPLLPNWKSLPVGYHGRAGTVVVSGTDIARPWGQRLIDGRVEVGPSTQLDIEAEIGFVVGVGSDLGSRVSVSDFADHVFGVCIVNDWSARDLQAWEYVPLGPFLGKSFATSISPWVVPLAALQGARVTAPARDETLVDYLDDSADPWGLEIDLEVILNGEVISRPPFAQMWWTAAQQLAHLTVNGASLRTGDLFASGTVSGPEPDQRGSLLELSWGGRDEVGSTGRTFLADGDEVVITAVAAGPQPVGLGEVRGRIQPAR